MGREAARRAARARVAEARAARARVAEARAAEARAAEERRMTGVSFWGRAARLRALFTAPSPLVEIVVAIAQRLNPNPRVPDDAALRHATEAAAAALDTAVRKLRAAEAGFGSMEPGAARRAVDERVEAYAASINVATQPLRFSLPPASLDPDLAADRIVAGETWTVVAVLFEAAGGDANFWPNLYRLRGPLMVIVKIVAYLVDLMTRGPRDDRWAMPWTVPDVFREQVFGP